MTELRVRRMRPDEIPIARAWAASEGWNPGVRDAVPFATVDPDGFFLGELDGEPAATVSCVRYDDRFAFLGFYIVRDDLRGRGFGIAVWNEAMAHAGGRTVGLDGVVAQQDNYRRSGFTSAYRHVRYGGVVPAPGAVPRGAVPLHEVPLQAIETSDARVFPAPRRSFLRAWVDTPGHLGRGLLHDGELVAWGVMRPAEQGYRVGPLVADRRASAEAVLEAMIADAGGAEIYLDVPDRNADAVSMAESWGLVPAFGTARMYTGPIRPVQVDHVFAVTTLELG